MKDERFVITRQSNDMIEGDVLHPTVYEYPYSTFPKLKSHLHPKFSIFDAGRKLDALFFQENSNPAIDKLFGDYPNSIKILHLYRAWIAPIPDSALKDTSYIDPKLQLVYETEDGSGDEPEDLDGDYVDQIKSGRGTESGRGDGYRLRPRRQPVAAADQDCKMGASKRKAPADNRKVLSLSSAHNQQLLSKATLSRFNQRVGEAVWTGERIRHWSNEKTFPKKRRVV